MTKREIIKILTCQLELMTFNLNNEEYISHESLEYYSAIKETIRIFEKDEDEKDGWILCSERLPYGLDRVLVKDIFDHIYIGNVQIGDFGDIYVSDDDYEFQQRDIVAWQRLTK